MELRGPYLSTFLRLALSHFQSPGKICTYQNAQLRKLISYAYRKVPFYREQFDSLSIKPNDIRTLKDLQKIPTITKEELRRLDINCRVSCDHEAKKLLNYQTTGSTGVPLQVIKSPLENWMFLLIRLQMMRGFGYRPSYKVFRIGRQQPKPLVRKILARFGLYRIKVVPLTLPFKNIADEILNYDPDVIVGLPSIIAQVALEIKKRKNPGKVEFVICGGEALTSGFKRQIEEVFGRVFNIYASIEAQHAMAVECGRDLNLHAVNRGVALEVLREDGQPVQEGQTGEVVITSLLSFSMPIIRYRMGDFVEVGPQCCPCGITGPVIRKIQGRICDIFYLPNGEKILPVPAAHKIQETADWIFQYELIQTSLQEVQLNTVPMYTPTENQIAELKRTVEACFEEKLSVSLRVVSSLRPGPGGKYRVFWTMLESSDDLAS